MAGERRRAAPERVRRKFYDFLREVVGFGHSRRAQARSAESESEENFAILEAQVVDFEHSSRAQIEPGLSARPVRFLTADPADFRDVFLNGAIS